MKKAIPQSERCSEPNDPDGTGWHSYRCSRRGTITEEGKPWCFQHAPSAKRERLAKSTARWEAAQDRHLAPARERDRFLGVLTRLVAWLDTRPAGIHVDAVPEIAAARAAIEDVTP